MKNYALKAKSQAFFFGAGIAFILVSICLLIQVTIALASITELDGNLVDLIHPLLSSLATAFLEEFIFRVLLLSLLLRVLKYSWLGILVGSIIFALPHLGNSHVTTIALVSHFFGGVVYSYAYYKTQSIWLPFGLHFGWNFTQILFGIPMSGSSYQGVFEMTFHSNDLISGGLYGFEGGIPSIMMRMVILLILIGFFTKNNFLQNRGPSTFHERPTEGKLSRSEEGVA